MGFLETWTWSPGHSEMPSCLQILLNSQVCTRKTPSEDLVLATDSLRGQILGLLPPGHWPFLSLEVSFGLLRELSEEPQVRTVDMGASSGHIKVWLSPSSAAGQNLAPLVKVWSRGQLCCFDPSVDLLSWFNPKATECNLIPSSGLLLAQTGIKRETVDKSMHVHHFYREREPQNLWSFSQRLKLTDGRL